MWPGLSEPCQSSLLMLHTHTGLSQSLCAGVVWSASALRRLQMPGLRWEYCFQGYLLKVYKINVKRKVAWPSAHHTACSCLGSIYSLLWMLDRTSLINVTYKSQRPIPVAVRSKALVCGLWIAGIAGLNPSEDVDFRLWCLLVLCT